MPQRYDKLLKETFREGIPSLFKAIFNKEFKIKKNLNVELQLKRFADFIFETEEGAIYHIEFQVRDDELMPYRMLEYFVLICSTYRKVPKQFVLYLGEKPPKKMRASLEVENLTYTYNLVYLKELNCQSLVESGNLNDLLMASLCSVQDWERYLKTFAKRLEGLPEKERLKYWDRLITLSGLRKPLMLKLKEGGLDMLQEVIKEHYLFKEGKEQGLKEGLEKGKELKAKEDVINLYRELKLSPEKIAHILKLPKEKVQRWLKEEGLI